MRYFVTVAGRTLEVELDEGTTRVNGREVRADLAALPGTPLRHLLLDGRSYPLTAEAGEARGGWTVTLDGRRFDADVVDERKRAIRAMAASAGGVQGPRPIRAPMPGLVTRLEVAAGEAVSVGQGLVIVEAMKMENELKAEAAGVVSRIFVAAGQAVEKGAVLIEFSASPA